MIKQYIEENTGGLYILLKDLSTIPAPSGNEEKRAQYCKSWLTNVGFKDVSLDNANNVICPINCENSNQITVVAAHTDTVFPLNVKLDYYEKDGKIFCPGVGDDTASASVLLMAAKYLHTISFRPENGLIILLNACEEGLGNLKGTWRFFEEYSGRIKQFITLDSSYDFISNKCVGSYRYMVKVKTEGGHSFQRFGNRNAIAELSKVINEIYKIDVPKEGDSRTTYNVGTITGGTSVNTIAQNAQILCEYRSDSAKCLSIMEKSFKCIIEEANSNGVSVEYSLIGKRPCANNVDNDRVEYLSDKCRQIIESITDIPIKFKSASTDCNVPMSLGIPAVCIGVYYGRGEHTTEEWIEKESLPNGLEIAIKIIIELS